MLTRSTKPHSLRFLPETPLPRAIHPSSPPPVPYLGGNYKEGSLRGQVGQCFGNVGPINVRDKPDAGTSFRVRLESFSHHEGSLQEERAMLESDCSQPSAHPRVSWALLTRSEPPMPMLMMSVMDLPVYPFQSPLLTRCHRGRCD